MEQEQDLNPTLVTTVPGGIPHTEDGVIEQTRWQAICDSACKRVKRLADCATDGAGRQQDVHTALIVRSRSRPIELQSCCRIAGKLTPDSLEGFKEYGRKPHKLSMDQASLYQCIRGAGYDVLMFEDHPQFFGNWRAHFKRGHDMHEIVCDNRDGWMTLWRVMNEKSNERLHEAEITRLDDAAMLQTLNYWIARR